MFRKGISILGSRSNAHRDLDALAQRIELVEKRREMALPEEARSTLRELATAIRELPTLQANWGLTKKSNLGRGGSLLLTGGSTTDRTLIAESIAQDLKLPLYRVDLSRVGDKFIGETEKNLSRLFNAAAKTNVVLLFDEADAFFGKRTDVKDSHDRYANIEASYLLDRIECHTGIVIIASNLGENLDDAFIRRLRHHIKLP